MRSLYIESPEISERLLIEELLNDSEILVTNNADIADGIVFCGGLDINPLKYDQAIHPMTLYDAPRDYAETIVFNKYKGKPMIGLGRGAQLGHVLSGGFLVQDADNHRGGHYAEYNGKNSIYVESSHHQLMGNSKVGEIFAIARASTYKEVVTKDKEILNIQNTLEYDIETMYHPATNFLSIQSHPEKSRYSSNKNMFFNLIKYLFNIG